MQENRAQSEAAILRQRSRNRPLLLPDGFLFVSVSSPYFFQKNISTCTGKEISERSTYGTHIYNLADHFSAEKWADTADDHGKPNTYGRSFMLRMNLFKS